MEERSAVENCLIFNFQPYSGRCEFIDREEILIFPGGRMVVQVKVPERFIGRPGVYPHIRSRFARAWLDVRLFSSELQKIYSPRPPSTLSLDITHFGRHPVRLREGDPAIAIVDHSQLDQPGVTPHREICPEAFSDDIYLYLSIGNTYLYINEERLPRIGINSHETVPYIDPLRDETSGYAEEIVFTELSVGINSSFVVKTKERLRMPRNEIGVLSVANDDFQHTSALIINPGSEGYQALELRANRRMIVRPGMRVMMLRMYMHHGEVQSDGRYANQHSLIL